MKLTAFHGVFLVLVMWADHSHGRVSETACTLTDFSQLPYKENMSAETEVYNRLKPYDYLFLVWQWPESFCTYIGGPCRPGIRNYFTVHGLWPQRVGVECINCLGVPPASLYDARVVCFVFPFVLKFKHVYFIFIHSLFL